MTLILFIGNSFTNRNDLPHLLARIAASADPPITIETNRVIANGVALKTHWDRGDAARSIQGEKWDYVSLQEQSTLPFKNPARMHEYVEKFDAEIRKQGAQTVLYLTWARQATPERQQEITEAYNSIGKKLGAIVVPAGIAWQRVGETDPQINLYDKDGSHPSLAGSYLAACTFFSSLFQQSPSGLWSPPSGLDRAAAERLQTAAWETVHVSVSAS